MSKKKSFKRSYRKKPELPLHRKRWFWLAVVLLILPPALVYLFTGSIFQVTEIQIVGASTLAPADILPIVEREIVSKIAFLSSRSIFLINRARISDKLILTFPQLNSVKVKRSFPRSVVVFVVERKAVASWCRNDGECFLIDRGGVIFEKAPDDAQLVIIKGGDGAVSLSGRPISSSEMEFIIKASRGLKGIVHPVTFNVNNPDVFVRTTEGWEVRFTLTKSPRIQTEKLILVLENTIPEEKRAKLDYVDVRFQDRVYFKYRERG